MAYLLTLLAGVLLGVTAGHIMNRAGITHQTAATAAPLAATNGSTTNLHAAAQPLIQEHSLPATLSDLANLQQQLTSAQPATTTRLIQEHSLGATLSDLANLQQQLINAQPAQLNASQSLIQEHSLAATLADLANLQQQLLNTQSAGTATLTQERSLAATLADLANLQQWWLNQQSATTASTAAPSVASLTEGPGPHFVPGFSLDQSTAAGSTTAASGTLAPTSGEDVMP